MRGKDTREVMRANKLVVMLVIVMGGVVVGDWFSGPHSSIETHTNGFLDTNRVIRSVVMVCTSMCVKLEKTKINLRSLCQRKANSKTI